MKDRDWILIDIVSQESIDLFDEVFEDLHSAISFTATHYPAKGAKQFKASLKKLNERVWKLRRRISGLEK